MEQKMMNKTGCEGTVNYIQKYNLSNILAGRITEIFGSLENFEDNIKEYAIIHNITTAKAVEEVVFDIKLLMYSETHNISMLEAKRILTTDEDLLTYEELKIRYADPTIRKYTSPKQKTKLYSRKYNIPEEELHRILSDYEGNLTFDELKIKYDDPNLGKLPDWLTEEDLQKVIERGINVKFDQKYSAWTTRKELVSYMQEFIRKNIHNYSSLAHIKSAVINRTVWLLRYQYVRDRHHSFSLDESLSNESSTSSDTNHSYHDIVSASNTDTEELEFKQNLYSIKDKQVRELLVVVGYLIGNINCLRQDYLNILRSSETEVQKNLKLIEEQLEERSTTVVKVTKKSTTSIKRKKLSIVDIIKSMKFKLGDTVDDTLNELKDYLRFIQFA